MQKVRSQKDMRNEDIHTFCVYGDMKELYQVRPHIRHASITNQLHELRKQCDSRVSTQ